nr:unnamed protein product [Spirometra erinaceieuropaei]
MGSPISELIAETVLKLLESLVFLHHRPKFSARYVDDAFVVIERDQVLTFNERLTTVFPDIQFTMEEEEEEENNQLIFLDVLVCCEDGDVLKTKLFTKTTNTMQVVYFNINHKICHKRSCVRTLYRRVEMSCNEPEDKIAEVQYLRLRQPGHTQRDEMPNRPDPKFWPTLSYVKNVSEAVGCLLVPLGVGVAHRPETTIKPPVMKSEDPLPHQETSRVVYRI